MRFRDLGTLFDGPHATPNRVDDGPYFLNISSLSGGRLDLALSDHIGEEQFQHWTRRVTPRADDMLFSYETRLGEAALMPDGVRACLGRRMALLRPNKAIAVPRFLLYWYLAPVMQGIIRERTVLGATVPRIPLSEMPDWDIGEFPPIVEQQAIAEVLGALDDKIAANHALARTADQLCEVLFVRVAEGASAWVPLGQTAVLVLGGTPSREREEFWSTSKEVAWLASGKANEARVLRPTEWITELGLKGSAAKMMPRGSTIVAITGATLGQVSRLEIEACGNQSLVGLWAPESALNDWLYFAVRTNIQSLVARATGGAQQHVNKSDVAELPIPVPTPGEIGDFGTSVRPLLDLAASLDRESLTLAELRDTLLPSLMDGTICVRDAATAAEEVL